MTVEDQGAGSTVPRRQLGRYLAELRAKAGLTTRAAARYLEWSETKIWRIETGKTPLRSLDVKAMCEIYQAPGDLTEALCALARTTKDKGWWHAYGEVIPEGFDLYIGLEAAASQLDTYETDLVPGLLQTADYAQQIMQADHQDNGSLDARVSLRVQRQALLTRPKGAPTFNVVLSETVLRRVIGGPTIMRDQLQHLLETSQMDHVDIRVVPFGAGLHPGVMTGAFTILQFPPGLNGVPSEPRTVYCDGYTGALYLDKERETREYADGFQAIWDAALSPHESTELITETAGSYA
ncbi:helix-turn-helix transcriptional regulator [Streptomyces sp. NPDC001941]|uniref:helix-turn-helix domain-containing protein n=1 Tax=Streptomyces sp. NPDC001941 TaxID=3154659 RepID=UPI003331A5DE